MSEITRQLERDAAFMKVLPCCNSVRTYEIDHSEAFKISASLIAAAREIERLEREISAFRRALEVTDGRGQSADSIIEDCGFDTKTWEIT